MRHWFFLAITALCAHADVTLRYKIDSTPAAMLPPGTDEAPSIRMKGTKGVTNVGRLKAILDVATREVTVIDEERKTFATFPAAEYGAKLSAANGLQPAAAGQKPPEMPKMDFKTRKTGRGARLLGVDAEETEASMDLPLEQFGIAISMRVWTPKASEVLRVPALREATAANLWLDHFLKVKDEFELPGLDGLPLRLEMEVRTTGAAVPGVDPSKPIFTMKMEAVELSTTALDEALFRVPDGFTAKRPEEVLKNQNVTVTAVSADLAGGNPVQAFVPNMDPVEAKHLAYPEDAGGAVGSVRMLVTIAADGSVVSAEPIAGPEPLRKFAVAEVQGYKYRPVLRDGKAVVAMTDASVFFLPPGSRPPMSDVAELRAATERVLALKNQFPRTPQQILADAEHEGEGRRTFHALRIAAAALDANILPTAEAYAKQALSDESDDNDVWNRGNRIHEGHIILGRIAVRRDNLADAREHLLAAGKTPGSPQLNSFGPDWSLAREILEKGDTSTVLAYIEECRVFWMMGGSRLDQWTAEIRAGKKPSF